MVVRRWFYGQPHLGPAADPASACQKSCGDFSQPLGALLSAAFDPVLDIGTLTAYPEVAIRALEWTAHRHGAGGPRFDYQGWVWLIDPVKVPVGHSLPRSTMRAASAYSGSLKRVGMMVLRLGSHAARALLLAEE